MACEEGSITISQDIITSILSRFPVKSLGRFRCVSKEWLSLLSEPQFISTHQKMLNGNHFVLRSSNNLLYSVPFNNNEAVSTLTKKPLFEASNFSILGSANGLVFAYSNDFKNRTFVFLNLTTKDSVELPISRKAVLIASLGFGYDSVTDDYKAVTMSYYVGDKNVMSVYSLRTNTWRQGSDHIPVIIAFSLADEKLSEVPSSNLYNDGDILSDSDWKLVALGDKLAIFNGKKGLVWLMNVYGVEKSWTKIVVHGFNDIAMLNPVIFYDNGKFLFVTHDLMRTYDLKEQNFCRSVDISKMNISWVIRTAYVESLVSPKLGGASQLKFTIFKRR